MKKTIICSLLFFTLTTGVYAATNATQSAASTTESPIPTAEATQLNDLKNRLATKVAQLRQTQKRAIYGTVKDTSVSTLTIETPTSEVKIELTDEIKVFQNIKGKRTALTTDDISKNDAVVVFGDYDTGLDLLKAKIIFIQDALPIRISGVVSAIDTKEYTLTVTTTTGQSEIVDIEKGTATNTWDKEKGITKSGFSKIALGDVVAIVGSPAPKEENRMSGIRILDLGNLSGTTPTVTPTTAPEEASSSGTPKATPKPTAKPTIKATPTSSQ